MILDQPLRSNGMRMKHLLITFVMLYGAQAHALLIPSMSNLDVGGIDSLLAVSDGLPNSGDAAEQAFMRQASGDDSATYLFRNEPVPYHLTDAVGVIAFEFTPTGDGYFIVKNSTRWAAYENVEDLDWGVIDTALLPPEMNLPGAASMEISHVSVFEGDDAGGGGGRGGRGGNNVVAAPGPLALMGLSLLGIAGVTRARA